MGAKPLAYDIGMNNGEDSDYYLAKGFRVVAVEANPENCRDAAKRFARQIANGDMIVENLGIGPEEGVFDFFVNDSKDALSTFAPQSIPREKHDPAEIARWTTIRVPVTKLSSVVAKYGPPSFMKIDIEYYDQFALLDLFHNGIVPEYVSAECHAIDVFCALVCMGYTKFKLLDGPTLGERFARHPVQTLDGGTIEYAFTCDSSGPFGEDIPGPWMDKQPALTALLDHGLGWIDVHAKVG
jgi:FkbM family methyltransferase